MMHCYPCAMMCLLPFQSEQNFGIVQNRIVEKQYKTKAVFLLPKQESSSRIEALRNVKDPRIIKSSKLSTSIPLPKLNLNFKQRNILNKVWFVLNFTQ